MKPLFPGLPVKMLALFLLVLVIPLKAAISKEKSHIRTPCSLSGELNLYKEMSVLNKKVLSLIQDVAGCNHMSPAEAVEWLDTHLLIR
ncbi:hypothetical protein [Klebsiella variicola]|uniref:hypothetical protein n=1 Tax=Klebsiella variicola TaxID=244366 RepID=UPI0021810957|nr:hypothetical protein [Klebsiella variicola]GKK30238.1 hypothetical protein NUKP39_16740 [Klebsiella variicola]